MVRLSPLVMTLCSRLKVRAKTPSWEPDPKRHWRTTARLFALCADWHLWMSMANANGFGFEERPNPQPHSCRHWQRRSEVHHLYNLFRRLPESNRQSTITQRNTFRIHHSTSVWHTTTRNLKVWDFSVGFFTTNLVAISALGSLQWSPQHCKQPVKLDGGEHVQQSNSCPKTQLFLFQSFFYAHCLLRCNE